MMCAWEPLRAVLPPTLQQCLNEDGQEMTELRLRAGYDPEQNFGKRSRFLSHRVSRQELTHIINAASRYSPWLTQTLSMGYLPLPGGHRIGICGQVILESNRVKGIREPDSLCIRIARDIPGIGAEHRNLRGSVLILGAPGWGKTTLLRDLAREMARERETVVVDERGELFPDGFARGKRMDVLSLCPKVQGLEMTLRTMGPEIVAVDEITSEEDCNALIRTANCGVTLLATAHAVSLSDLKSRSVYRKLLEKGIFQNILLMRQDRSCKLERMTI